MQHLCNFQYVWNSLDVLPVDTFACMDLYIYIYIYLYIFVYIYDTYIYIYNIYIIDIDICGNGLQQYYATLCIMQHCIYTLYIHQVDRTVHIYIYTHNMLHNIYIYIVVGDICHKILLICYITYEIPGCPEYGHPRRDCFEDFPRFWTWWPFWKLVLCVGVGHPRCWTIWKTMGRTRIKWGEHGIIMG